MSTTHFGTVLADPPWPYHSPRAVIGLGGAKKRGREDIIARADEIVQVDVTKKYDTMSTKDIAALPVREFSAPNAHLYLWTTNAFMVEAHDIARAWGFEPKTILTWVKTKKDEPESASMAAGYWYRGATEHIVFGVRGRQRLLGPAVPTAYFHSRLPHSVKPDMFYDLIEQQSPGPYLELFARRRHSEKWDVWGNQIDSSIDLK